jgi:hypothetical protein
VISFSSVACITSEIDEPACRVVLAEDTAIREPRRHRRRHRKRRIGHFLASLNSDCLSASQAACTAEPFDAAVHEPPSTGDIGNVESPMRAHVIERQAKGLGTDLGQDRPGPGADIGRRGGDLQRAVGLQGCARLRLLQECVPHPGGNAPADQFAAILHHPRLRLAFPAECRRALIVAIQQRLGGELLVGVFVLGGKIDATELERIDVEFIRQFIEGAFQRRDADRRTRRAHVAGRGVSSFAKLIGQLDVVAVIHHA